MRFKLFLLSLLAPLVAFSMASFADTYPATSVTVAQYQPGNTKGYSVSFSENSLSSEDSYLVEF